MTFDRLPGLPKTLQQKKNIQKEKEKGAKWGLMAIFYLLYK